MSTKLKRIACICFADDALRKDEAVPEKKIARRDQQTQTRDVCSDSSSLRRSTSLGGDLDTSRPTPDASCNQEIFEFLSHLENEVSKLRAQSDCNLSSEDVDRKFLKTLKNNITEWKEKSMTIGSNGKHILEIILCRLAKATKCWVLKTSSLMFWYYVVYFFLSFYWSLFCMIILPRLWRS